MLILFALIVLFLFSNKYLNEPTFKFASIVLTKLRVSIMTLKKLRVRLSLLLVLLPLPIFAQTYYNFNVINGTNNTFTTNCSPTKGNCKISSKLLPYQQITGHASYYYGLRGHILIAKADSNTACIIDYEHSSSGLNLKLIQTTNNVECVILREGIYIKSKNNNTEN